MSALARPSSDLDRAVESKREFRDQHGLNVPLLADLGGEVAKSYGVFRRGIGTKRATFVIDAGGVVRAEQVHTLGLDFETVDDLREMLRPRRGLTARHRTSRTDGYTG